MTSYKIKTIAMSDDEKLPLLIETKTGLPDYWTTLYTTTQLKSKGLAVKTIEQTLQHLKLLMFFLKNNYSEEINLEERLKDARLLSVSEMENIGDLCTLPIEDLTNRDITKQKPTSTVDPKSTAHRIKSIKNYLLWLNNTFLSHINNLELKKIESTLEAKIPKIQSSHTTLKNKALSKDEIELVFTLIKKNSKTNPWKSYFTRTRNELIFFWFYEFGLKRGELLNLQISDLNFQEGTVSLLQQTDNSTAKSQRIKLPISKKTLDLTYAYLFGVREKLPQSVYHPYLFVADKSGLPMSSPALNKIFSELRKANSLLPQNFSPQMMRHACKEQEKLIQSNNFD